MHIVSHQCTGVVCTECLIHQGVHGVAICTLSGALQSKCHQRPLNLQWATHVQSFNSSCDDWGVAWILMMLTVVILDSHASSGIALGGQIYRKQHILCFSLHQSLCLGPSALANIMCLFASRAKRKRKELKCSHTPSFKMETFFFLWAVSSCPW